MAVPTATELAAIAAIQKADKEAAHERWLVHFVAPIYDNIVQWGQGKLKDECVDSTYLLGRTNADKFAIGLTTPPCRLQKAPRGMSL
jgi:hypothetical protein